MIDGLAVVDKPAGMTSHDVVGRCRRIFGQKRVGHGGTLDPDATGVLLVGLGRATRLLQWITALDKSYTCTIVLGVATSTLDAAGEVTATFDMAGVTDAQVASAAAGLTGDLLQVPPMVSAVKIGGKRLHQLAREGVVVERPPRPVHVAEYSVGPLRRSDGRLEVDASVTCSSGTYVRVLAADLGVALGGGAHLRDLRRTRIGRFTASEAVALDDLGPADVLPPVAAVGHLQPVAVDAPTGVAVGHGKVLGLDALGATGEGPWAVSAADGSLLAVYEAHGDGRAKPVVVLAGD